MAVFTWGEDPTDSQQGSFLWGQEPGQYQPSDQGGVLGFVQGVNEALAPTPTSAVKGNAAKSVSGFISNFLKGAGRAAVGIPATAVLGTVGAADKAYNAVTGHATPTTGFLGQANQVASALPSGIWDFAKGEAQGAANLLTPGKSYAQLQQIGENNYQDPFNALLNVSGAGDALGGGIRIAGGISDGIALDAARTAARLTPEEAATASISRTSPLTGIGSGIQELANVGNPIGQGITGLTSAKNGVGTAIRKLLGFTTGTGEEGANAIRNIASGDVSAVQGMRGAGTGPQQAGLKEALNVIDTANVDAGNGGFIEMAPVRQQVVQTLQDHGMNPVFMSEQEVNALREGIPYSQAKAIYDKYALGPDTADTFSQVKDAMWGNRFKNKVSGPTQEQVEGTLKKIADRNGYIGVQQGLSSLPKSAQANLTELAENVFKTGGGAGGYEANATNLQRLKNQAGSYYNDSFAASPEQKAANAAVTRIKAAIDGPLRQFPEYADANAEYSKYYGGSELNKLTPQRSAVRGISDIGLDFLLAHYVNPALGIGSALTQSPRSVGELANAYGKTAGAYGKVTAPFVTASQYSALNALLNQIAASQSERK